MPKQNDSKTPDQVLSQVRSMIPSLTWEIDEEDSCSSAIKIVSQIEGTHLSLVLDYCFDRNSARACVYMGSESRIFCSTQTKGQSLEHSLQSLVFYLGNLSAALLKGVENCSLGVTPIAAEAYSSDGVCQVRFSAREWFEQASESEILALAECSWGGDYPADTIALFYEDREIYLSKLLEHSRVLGCGFEVVVNQEDAIGWLLVERPEIYEKVKSRQLVR